MVRIRSVLLCLCAAYVHMMSFGLSGALGMVFIELQELFDSSKAATAWVSSLFIGVFLGVGALTGSLVKRYGCRNMSTLGSVILTGSLVASYFTPSLEVLYVTFTVSGIGASFMHAPAFVVVIQNFDKHRSLALGLSGTGVSVGFFVLPYLTFAASETFGVRGTFIVLAALTSQAIVFSFAFEVLSSEPKDALKYEAATTVSDKKSCSDAWKNHFDFCSLGYFLYSFSYVFYVFGHFVTFILFPDVVLSRGLSKEQASIVATCLGVGAIIGRSSFTFIGDIQGVNPIFLHIVPTFLFGVLILIVAFVWEYGGFIAIAVLVGIASGPPAAMHPAIIADIMGTDDISVALGWLWVILAIPSALGPPLAGWLTDVKGDYQTAKLFSGSFLVFSALSSIFAFWLKRCQTKSKSNQDQKRTHIELNTEHLRTYVSPKDHIVVDGSSHEKEL